MCCFVKFFDRRSRLADKVCDSSYADDDDVGSDCGGDARMRTGCSVSGEADKEIDVRAVGVFHIIRNFGVLVNVLNAFISEKSQLRNQGAKRCENGQNDGRSRAFG